MHIIAMAASTVRYYTDPKVGIYGSPEAALLKPHLARLTDELVKAYELQKHMTLCEGGTPSFQLLPSEDATRFHTDEYVEFLQRLATEGREVAKEAAGYALNASVCFSELAWQWSQTYAGASVEAASSLTSGAAKTAINWMGGQMHARRDCASGFSYVNDVVLAILTLLRVHERVMFVNLDAWHCSGVEEAFYTTDKVLCVSLHRRGEAFFPGSGDVQDTGAGGGAHHTVNMPVAEGLTDEELEALFVPVVAAAAERFQPDCVVYCAGAGVLSGDRLGCLNVSMAGFGKCMQAVLDIDKPLLLLGAGGSHQTNTARAWVKATAMACGQTLPDALPEHDFADYYHPEMTLHVPAVDMTDKNTPEALKATLDACLATAAAMPARTASSGGAAPKPAAAAGDDAATTATGNASEEVDSNGKLAALQSGGLTADETLLTSPLSNPRPGADVPMDAGSELEPAASMADATDGGGTEAPMEAASEDPTQATQEPAGSDAMDMEP